jgi:hypothetical protein
MSTFWMIYFICLGVAIFFTLLTMALFEQSDGDRIPTAYAIFAVCICAIPGPGIVGTLLLLGGICCLVVEGELLPRKFEKENE